MRITFFKTGKAKQFNYIPRYYDEQKEEFEERQRRIEQELGIEDNKEVFRTKITRGVMSERLNMKKKISRGSTLRILILVIVLTLLMLYLLRDFESFNFLLK